MPDSKVGPTPPSTSTVGDATPYLESARSFHDRWEETDDPSFLVQAADSILRYYRWWLWKGVLAVDPVAIDEDNLLTRTRRVATRLRRIDARAADRVEELGREAHRLRGGMYHRDEAPPDEKTVFHLLACAPEFSAHIETVVARFTLPTSHDLQQEYLDQQLVRIRGGAGLLRGHYSDSSVDEIEASITALERLRPFFLKPGMAEPLIFLLREYENRVEELGIKMYYVCPKCGGDMEERTREVGHGGVEGNPAPTNVTVWWEISCKACGHVLERESVAEHSV